MRLTLKPAIIALLLAILPALAHAENCGHAYGRIAGIKAWAKIVSGKALVKIDSESFNVFEKIRMNPAAELTPKELEHIKSHKLEATLDAYRNTNSVVRKFNQLIALQKRAQPMKKAHKPWPGFKKWTADMYAYLGYSSQGMLPQDTRKAERLIADYLGQGLLPASSYGGPTRYAGHIYAKALVANDFTLGEFDAKFLKFWRLDKDFERFTADAQRYREGFLTATKIQETTDNLKWGVMSTAMAAAYIAPLLSERIESPERLERKVSSIKGGVQLMFSDDPQVPVLLRTKGEAVLFEMPSAKFLKGDKLAEFDRMLAEKKINYSRVVINANPEEVKKVMGKAKEFVTRTKMDANGQKILDQRMHLDSGLAESYKILQSELGFPPAPIAKRYSSVMSAYFGIMKLAGGKEGRVKDFFVSRTAAESKDLWREATEQALSAYFDAMLYAFSPKLTGGGALAVDALPNTLWKKEVPIKEMPKLPEEIKPKLPTVPVSQ